MTDSIHATNLRTNARRDPLGIDTRQPEFSWEWTGPSSSYRMRVSGAPDFSALVWDTGLISDQAPFGVRYDGAPLDPQRRYWWQVADGMTGEWSSAAEFETAFFAPDAPVAEWIGAPPSALDDEGALYLNRVIDLPSPVTQGRLYASALGWYRFFINGRDITNGAQVPRWTPLGEIVEYQTYDVTDQLTSGANALAIAVGDGRYRGYLGGERRRKRFGDRLAAFALLELDLEDGTRITVATDTGWFAGPGRILASDPQSGERVDARTPDAPWLAGETTGLVPAVQVAGPHRTLIAEEVDRLGDVMTLRGVVSTSPAGKQLIDFGQNFTGVIRVRLFGAAGTTVRITHSELLTPEGELDETYLWDARTKDWWQRDEVMLDGTDFWYRPWFAIRGFRYVEIDGLDSALTADDVEGIVMSTELASAGTFECSDPRLNKLYANVVWSMRGNFLDTPTDCPTRERAGWTGDAQVFAPTATHLMDVQAYFRRYMRNLRIDQLPDGTVPPFIPNQDPKTTGRRPGIAGKLESQLPKSTGWGDAVVLIPWAMYEAYADTDILRDNYDAMTRWVAYLRREAATKRGRSRWFSKRLGDHDRYIIGSGHHFGEWLRPDDGITQILQLVFAPSSVVATAYYAHSTQKLSDIAALLGRVSDAEHYGELARQTRAAWRAAFVRDGGRRIGEDKQDDYVRAIAFDLIDERQRPAALARLVELIEEAGDHLGTGFLSTPMLLSVLTEGDRADIAYRLLMQDTVPSWLYPLSKDATTVWEKWNGFKDDGHGTGSHNHYSFGAVASWLVESVAGLSAAAPGYRVIRIAPEVGGPLSRASATQETPFGTAKSSWWIDGELVRLTVVIPPGTSAVVHGGGETRTIGSGEHDFEWARPDTRAVSS